MNSTSPTYIMHTKTIQTALALALAASLSACGNYGGGGGGGGGGGQVVPTLSAGNTGGASTEEMVAAFTQTVYTLNRDYCADCHAGAGPGSPHISHPDPGTAYAAVVDNQKVNLASPESSRLVRRLVTDFHHCWDNCVMDGAEMQAAIEAWATLVNFDDPADGTQVEGLASTSLTLADGAEDQGSERYDRNQIAFYDFKTGAGTVAVDKSGVEPAMDLVLLDDVDWMSNYGLAFENGRALASPEGSRKLYDRIADPDRGSQQFSVEAWVIPANVDQEGPARILSYSAGTNERNFTLGQVLYNYNFRNRNLDPEVDDNGRPALQTYDADEDLQATLQHVVITYDQYRGRRIYVNGVFTDDEDESVPQRLWNWNPAHRFVLGNETNGRRPWEGRIQLVAIYDHVMTEAQILQNFQAGVGKRLLLNFDVSQWAGNGAYVQFTVSELDEFSYLFCQPTFVSNPSNLRVSNLRILVNGQAPVSGQAFVNTDAVVTEAKQELSRQCSVIAKGPGGAASDVFAVQFEVLGGFEDPVVPIPPTPPSPGQFVDPLPLEGVRDFARINETMSSVTGVDANTSGPRETFGELTEQLPSNADIRTFSSSQQVAIAKLALEYCDRLVDTPNLRQAFWPGFDFSEPASTAFDSQGKRDAVIQPLVNKMIGTDLTTQPTLAEVTPILEDLLTELTADCPVGCDVARTGSIMKGACAATLSSAALSIH